MARSLWIIFWIATTSILLPCGAHSSEEQDSGVCNTQICQDAAHSLLDSMDTTADPCENFFQYACGGWIENNPIPEEKSIYSTFHVLQDQSLDRVAAILRTPEAINHRLKAVRDSAALFLGCMDEDAREEQGLDPIIAVLDSIGGWPMANPTWSDSGYQWQMQVATLTRTLDLTPIISVTVDIDANRTSRHAIIIDQPYFGLGRNQLIDLTAESNIELVAAYRNYIIATAKLLNPDADDSQVAHDADEMIQFESSLAQFSKPNEERRDASTWYHKMTVAEMAAETENTHFEWTDFLNEIFKDFPLVTDETEIILSEKDYIKNALELANQTDPRILANYMGWNVLMSMGPDTTNQSRENDFQFQKVQMGIEKPELLQRICIKKTIELLGFAVGRLYVDEFFTQQQKRDVDRLVEDIRQAYISTLTGNTWMDANTKNKALQKLRAMKSKMGYPPWIKRDRKLNNYYRGVRNVRRNSYFESLLKVYEAVTAINLKTWNQPTNKAKWDTAPPVVNAFYNAVTNSITFPAGILDLPFFKYGRSPALNYGGIGGVIGHEISHGFDDQGAQFDKEGNLVNWWSEETKVEFNRKADCFRNQYSSFVEPTTNMTLNGNNTIGENIADNGALRNAFKAYKTYQRRSGNQKTLPGVPATPDQLFFLGYSSVWCAAERSQFLQWAIQYDPHAPNRYRAVIPLANSRDFAQAFNCPLGSAMNPESKCELW